MTRSNKTTKTTIFLVLLLLVLVQAQACTKRYVAHAGKDAGDCSAEPCKTLSYCVSQAENCDTIYLESVFPYTERETITITKSLTITTTDAQGINFFHEKPILFHIPAQASVNFTLQSLKFFGVRYIIRAERAINSNIYLQNVYVGGISQAMHIDSCVSCTFTILNCVFEDVPVTTIQIANATEDSLLTVNDSVMKRVGTPIQRAVVTSQLGIIHMRGLLVEETSGMLFNRSYTLSIVGCTFTRNVFFGDGMQKIITSYNYRWCLVY